MTDFNFTLDTFLDRREMRSLIINDTRLQPDHFKFEKEQANALIERFRVSAPEFCRTYDTFIAIFDDLRNALASYRLSAKHSEPVRRSAVLLSLFDGFHIFDQPFIPATDSDTISESDLMNLRAFRTADGNDYSGDDLLEGIFDTLKVALDYCAFLKSQTDHGDGAAPDLRLLFRVFNQFRIYKNDWLECLCLGNEVDTKPEALADNAIEIAQRISLAREGSLRMQHISFGGAKGFAVAQHRFVDGQLRVGRKNRRDFAKFRASMHDHIAYPFLRNIIRHLKADHPASRALDIYLLLTFISLGNLSRFGLKNESNSYLFDATSFGAFVAAFLDMDEKVASELLDRFVFVPGQKHDIWFTPLVRFETSYALLSPMCAHANFERYVEELVSGNDDIDIGRDFETYIADLTSRAIKKALLPFAVRGPMKLKPNASTFEEIDLLILADKTIYLAEVKYDAFSAEPLAILQHVEKMAGACKQAARKADFLIANWSALSSSLNWPADIEGVVPFALTEKTFLNGFSFRGVPIVALRDFEDFFSGEILFNLSLGKGGIISGGSFQKTFESPQSAASDLETYLSEPLRRREFAKRLRIRAIDRTPTQEVRISYRRHEFEVVNVVSSGDQDSSSREGSASVSTGR
ncbi:hypothetical protein ABIB90_008359 [Bradyrhizobium sp. JR4.1]|uniref:hypothetical protein n=1 Tax=unclassified Bradyrhizobium TaxID=2631580 RepID=UPI003394ADCD